MTYRTIRTAPVRDIDDEAMRTQIERIKKLIDRWPHQLGLGFWSLTYSYSRMPKEHEANHEKGHWGTLADIVADWRYKYAFITFYIPSVMQSDDDELEYAFVHEHVHAFVNELRGPGNEYEEGSAAQAHEESVVTALAKAFLWARDAAVAYPSKWCSCDDGKCVHRDQGGDSDSFKPSPFGVGEGETDSGLAGGGEPEQATT